MAAPDNRVLNEVADHMSVEVFPHDFDPKKIWVSITVGTLLLTSSASIPQENQSMLISLDECGDRIEAATLAMDRLRTLSYAVRHNDVNVFELYHYQRETERLLEGIKSAIKLVGYEPINYAALDETSDDRISGHVAQQSER